MGDGKGDASEAPSILMQLSVLGTPQCAREGKG